MLGFMLVLAVVLTVSYCSYFSKFLIFQYKNYNKTLKGIPGIGVIYLFFGVEDHDLYGKAVELCNFINGSFSFWFGPIFFLIAKKPEEVKIMFNSMETFDKPEYLNKIYIEHGLINESGERYKLHRKTISPLFAVSNLKKFYPIINEKMTNFLSCFQHPQKEFNISDDIMDFSLDTILKTIFNIDHIDQRKRRNYLENMNHYLSLSSMRLFKFWLTIDFVFKRSKMYAEWSKRRNNVFKFAENLLKENEEDFRNGNPRDQSVSFTDYFYKIRDTMSYEETLEHVLFFLAGSYETTGSALPHTLLSLAMNPEIQNKAYEEISSILSSSADIVSEDQIYKMKYLDRCIKEALRLFPVTLFLARKTGKDLKFVDSTLPENTTVLIFTQKFHLSREFWGDDVMDFNPDRFTEENFKNVHSGAYFPFSNGPRICPGQKHAWIVMKIFLSRFLMKYKIHTTLKYEELKFNMRLTASITQGAMMSLEERGES